MENKDIKKTATDQGSGDGPEKNLSGPKASDHPGIVLWKRLLFLLITVVLMLALLEVALFSAGVNPVLLHDDPFVGFAENIPLYITKADSQPPGILETAPNKLTYFNLQTFSSPKKSGTYRIFTLGGSTTYGRPYNDSVSFSGWLREFLPAADSSRNWEVINAGGISYASYRVARLMKELVQYEPDLFIIYTGHNEFLERRSYGQLRGGVKGAATELAGKLATTRTWSALSWSLQKINALPKSKDSLRATLPGEVETILKKTGPDSYSRDDALRQEVVEHYRLSLERMVDQAKAVGAAVIFVSPAASLKDCTPFKSEHTKGLSAAQRSRSLELLSAARKKIKAKKWSEALAALDEALIFDPRFAELHYRRGNTLFALRRYDEAKAAFRRAKEEDVCSLRSLDAMGEVLAEVAKNAEVPLVDFVQLLEGHVQDNHGHTILGQEFFLDHVHPTIEGNQLLAQQLVEVMGARGIVEPSETWGDQAIATVTEKVHGQFDKPMQALGLANLARVLAWSGKGEDAERLAVQALQLEVEDPYITKTAATVIASQYLHDDPDRAWEYFRLALNTDPMDSKLHSKLGQWIADTRNRQVEVGYAHLLHASVFWSGPNRDRAHMHLGVAMAQRGRPADALAHFLEAQRLNPKSADAKKAINQLRRQSAAPLNNVVLQKVSVKKYPSGNIKMIVQVKPDATGRYIADGFWTEWYEGGELKGFMEYLRGVPQGNKMAWDQSGRLLEES
ncbi:MAG: hypothetical protein C0613_16005 [Desulfobulbaceae bacterium]|nr:MAG: hypothetical protein C0613_16005 [Desulfobulbaceae bacterium]